ncbi:MAG: hypothetical protein ACR2HG_03760 [Pyrinomonadaceae bacterium]
MRKLFKIKSFKYGFILGIFLSSIIQLLEYANYLSERESLINLSRAGIHIDTISHWGIPFPIFYGGHFILAGLIANISVALIFSFLLGSTFKLVWSKISSRRMK